MTFCVFGGTLSLAQSININLHFTYLLYLCAYVDCSSQNGSVDEDQLSTEEFYASLRKTAADIEMLNNFD